MNTSINNISINNISKYFNGIDIIYWINLNRSIERKENMINILKLLPVKNIRIEAIDGKNESDISIYGMFDNIKKEHSKIEYACLLSHLNTIKQFSISQYNIALILEDDMNMEFVKYWNKSIEDIIKDAPSDWDIIMLNYITTDIINLNYTINDGSIYSTGAYIINKKGSKKLINSIYKNNKYYLDNQKSHAADGFLFISLITYIYKYPYFTYPNDNNSTIHNNHLNYHMKAKNNTIKLWKNKKIEGFNNNSTNIISKIIILLLILILIAIILLNYSKC